MVPRRGWQDGGGLYVAGTASLTNTNVYANLARNAVRELVFWTFLELSSRWNLRALVLPGRVVASLSLL